MNIETRLTHGLETSQQLNLAPQLLQWLKLLQLPSVELATLVRQELETNPALEAEEPESNETSDETVPEISESTDAAGDFETEPATFDNGSVGERLEILSGMGSDGSDEEPMVGRDFSRVTHDDEERRQYVMDSIASPLSLQEHLLFQLNVLHMDAAERRAGEAIIGSLDPRGYLSATIEELAGMAKTETGIVESALRKVQAFDPPGVAARDLRECLALQIRDASSVQARIVDRFLDALARRQFREIAAALDVAEEDVLEALKAIRLLDPEPGRKFSQERPRYIVADITVTREDANYVIALNDESMPKLYISADCRQMLENGKLASDDLAYLRRKMRNASFLIQGIRQRQETLRKVAAEIVRHQKSYLDSEDGELRPLTMQTVAQAIGVHETTVSRAIANKHMRTPRGLHEMKHFFRAGYACENGSGLIPAAVQDIILNLIQAEDKAVPLTDLQIVKLLKEKGLKVARRTVAKYREEMGMGSSKERAIPRSAAPILRLRKPEPVPVAVPAEKEDQRVYA